MRSVCRLLIWFALTDFQQCKQLVQMTLKRKPAELFSNSAGRELSLSSIQPSSRCR